MPEINTPSHRIYSAGTPETCRGMDCIHPALNGLRLGGQVEDSKLAESDGIEQQSQFCAANCPFGELKKSLGEKCMWGVMERPEIPTPARARPRRHGPWE